MMNNAFYWGFHERLEPGEVLMLRRIQNGTCPLYPPLPEQRFAIAHLIAIDCVVADYEEETLTVTEKGEDAIAFYPKFWGWNPALWAE